ncbi:hypothetical protein JCM3775_003094 [Rhodotorula graminis]|uniref:Distal membrane-arm assembly complex protein 1-like domain-containing protein n=1 Tax=Rhodotorula graminis (strain WP1) TaxID=578459 RepID=A0A194S7L5_RHOGW|nr:uncharacterized protein RHOBADRAFT_42887 [Rhodotorula graminis WP1]KPV76544.1 hypothetical protein RHOBADRAFT_42887 [Rhodotorula graminis WP1]
MSSFIPSTLRTRPDAPQDAPTSSSPPRLSLPDQVYTDCQSCRITGTLTFSAVGLYALTVSRATAKTPVGKGAASLMGLGFLAVAAARWNTYSPPPVDTAPPQPA